MNEKEINVAIVGYGLAGSVFHAPLIKSTAGMKVKAIVARSPEKQEKARTDFPDAIILPDLEALRNAASEYDLAVIATPNKDHAAQAMALMDTGLAVVIDKPVAINSKECVALIERRNKTGALLSVFQNRRWDNDFLTIKKLIDDGTLGKVIRYESRFERYRPVARQGAWREQAFADEGGGILFDLGSHLIDQAVQLFGKPVRIHAEIHSRRAGVNADDDCFLALSFAGGVEAHLWMSAIAACLGHRFRVLGLEGAYEKYGLDPQEDALRAGDTPANPNWGKENERFWGKLTTYAADAQKKEETIETLPGSYQNFYAQMKSAIQGESEVPVSVEGALSVLEIIEEARKSILLSSAKHN